MKISLGLKWGLIFGLLIGIIGSFVVYVALYLPHISELQKEYSNLVFNETENETLATLAYKEFPSIFAYTIILVSALSYTISGGIGGVIIAYIWDKVQNWLLKGIVGGIITLLVALLLGPLYLYEALPLSLLIGLITSYKLNEINRKV